MNREQPPPPKRGKPQRKQDIQDHHSIHQNTSQPHDDQAPPLQFGGQKFSVNQSVAHQATPPTSLLSTIQPPAFASASQAAAEDSSHSKSNIYAIQTSLAPVARGSNNDSPFFESLNKLFAEENDNSTPARIAAQTNNAGALTPAQLQSTNKHASASKVVSNKAPHLKPAPVKAAVGKVRPTGISKSRRQAKGGSAQIAPYDHLKNMLAERGYSFGTMKSVEAGYMTDPSPLQIASFGTRLVNAVHTSDVNLLSSLLSCGLSPNPCNQFRDSTLDWACKKANDVVFQCFVDHNADLRVCDGFGRTPLHHAAWADTFCPAIARGILQRDPVQLFLKDNTDRTPLEYVPSKLTTQWIAFLDSHKEELFPIDGPPLAVTKRLYSQLPDPPNAISVDLARLVSAGQVQPEQIATMDELTRKTWTMRK